VEWLNFHHLRYFWTVARKRGARKAPEDLHVSQPSISVQIGLLEDSLGEKLFKRDMRTAKSGTERQRLTDHIDKASKQRPPISDS
jgi:DNA-binding transcriptional LysR family regulator